MSRILLGVSGGIAAFKSLDFIRRAQEDGHSVRVLQTAAAQRFIGSDSFAAISGAPVLLHEHQSDPNWGAFPGQTRPATQPISHLAVADNADVYLIAPATANTIAKLAHGFADNILSSAALACRCPLLIAPAMNNQMFEHAATQANLAVLSERGVGIVGPENGRLASRGEHGMGRLAGTAELIAACEQAIAERIAAGSGSWAGKRVLVSAGGTREPVDAVRFIGNRSSGRMGVAIADAAMQAGAEVTLVAANLALAPTARVRVVAVQTAAEMQQALLAELPHCDVLFMAAAVADFRPADPAAGKIKKAGRESLRIELQATEDVLKSLSQRKRADQIFVGFAAEHGEDAEAEALRKLSDKGLAAIVINDISRTDIGFEAERNEVTVLSPGARREIPIAGKRQVAVALLEAVAQIIADGPSVSAGPGSPVGEVGSDALKQPDARGGSPKVLTDGR